MKLGEELHNFVESIIAISYGRDIYKLIVDYLHAADTP
jgi:hypothetical protein